jgi:ABC-type transport system involved in cytochrome bd biosynthesis fused ATPase/permease subunit
LHNVVADDVSDEERLQKYQLAVHFEKAFLTLIVAFIVLILSVICGLLSALLLLVFLPLCLLFFFMVFLIESVY